MPSFESDGLLRTLYSANASPCSFAQCVALTDLVAREPDVRSAAMDSFLLPGFFAMIAGFFGLVSQIAVQCILRGRGASTSRDPERCERALVMNQRATDTHEQVLKFAPKEKAQNRVAELDDAGQAIVAQIRTAADLAKEDCDRAMSLAHKLSMELRAAEDRTHEMEAEVEHWRERAARAEQWLRIIQNEIEEKLLVSHRSEDTQTA